MTTPNPLVRTAVAALDELLGVALPVLDEGFVRVVDYMGDERSVVQAARVSYGAGTKRLREDRALIRYLMRHSHTTPFEMCELKLHVRAPMDVWRQWIRHRTASVNEYSTRYSIAIDAAQKTPAHQWRRQSPANKQGSAGFLAVTAGEKLSASEAALQALARKTYETRIAEGVAREQARKDLPLSTYTEAYWKIDLHNLLHFLNLRMASHAQAEIQSYATTVGERIVAKWVPIVWEAFLDYGPSSLTISKTEAAIAKALVMGTPAHALELAVAAGLIQYEEDGTLIHNRERAELETKLADLGLTIPWAR